MIANAANIRRAGLLLRGMSGNVGTFVDPRKVAKDKGIVATDQELAEIESYLLGQGWIVAEKNAPPGENRYSITRHGFDEMQRKMPAEPKVYEARKRDE
jgi:hypothetical protein